MDKKKNSNITLNRRIFNSYISSRKRRGFSAKTIKKSEQAITHLEKYLNGTSLKKINAETFNGFRDYLNLQTYRGNPISSNTKVNIISQIYKFFEYLSEQKGYKRIVTKDVLNCCRLSPSEKQSMKNSGRVIKVFPKMEDIRKIIKDIPSENIVDRRDRALISYLTITGARISAAVTMSIGLFDQHSGVADQDPDKGVETKNKKHIITTIPGYYDDIFETFLDWIQELRSLGFKNSDPMFPKAERAKKDEMLEFAKSNSLTRNGLSTKTGEKIVKERCRNSGFEKYHAHLFRDSHIYYGLKFAQSGLEIKAVSMNVGHDSISTTLQQYANISPNEVHEIILNMKGWSKADIPKELEEKFKDFLRVFDKELYDRYYSGTETGEVYGI